VLAGPRRSSWLGSHRHQLSLDTDALITPLVASPQKENYVATLAGEVVKRRWMPSTRFQRLADLTE
jgi:hypothetical protein